MPSKHEVIINAEGKAIWQDRFGTQLELRMLHRAQDNDAIDLYLTFIYRSSGNIISWASRQFYSGEMSTARANRKLSPAHQQLMKHFRQYSPNIRFYSLFVDLDLMETKVASSFSSYTTVRFYMELALSLFRDTKIPRKTDPALRPTILIISDYKVQVHEMRAIAEEVKRHALPERIIDIHTVDDSPSHEADIVIYNLPRSSGVGFLGNPQRMCVASTRARYTTIYVGRVQTLEQHPLLKSLIALHRDLYALVLFPRHRQFCTYCCIYGHDQRGCVDTRNVAPVRSGWHTSFLYHPGPYHNPVQKALALKLSAEAARL